MTLEFAPGNKSEELNVADTVTTISSTVKQAGCPVSCFTEWDPLEEMIVGNLDGAMVPKWHDTLYPTMPENKHEFFKRNGGKPFPPEQIEAGRKELEEFVRILEGEGVKVVRPDVVQHSKPYSTPDWSSPSGLYAAMPRDVMLVIGDEIIEAPMAWRSRYYEINAYRRLIRDYFERGAKWSAGPKPQLLDDLYVQGYDHPLDSPLFKSVITEFEPTFDAADFVRCGKDIIGQLSHTTNRAGVRWLQRQLGDAYRVHIFEFQDAHPMHIDATFMPIAPGKLLVNPERCPKVPDMFKHWDVFEAPEPCMPVSHTLYMTSRWISMNIIMLDEKRVVVEAGEESTIRAFKKWGFQPIPCKFRNFNSFGGSFHCATMDVRRRGELKSYL
jgi:glycine amidinotransferase